MKRAAAGIWAALSALLAASLILSAAVVSPASAQVQADDSAQPGGSDGLSDRCMPQLGGVFSMNVLLLIDASRSLVGTDPAGRRVSGVVRTVDTLRDLSVR
ncbi:hypothetical protein [Candidatus Poriferisocius sp.]|uniref:hypothetical protein n=1 Tax=Candidatus Poriferisocius sp. TaxID=3101276 RepID=UPI003B01A910